MPRRPHRERFFLFQQAVNPSAHNKKFTHLFALIIVDEVLLLVCRQFGHLDDLVLGVLGMLAVKILRQLVLAQLGKRNIPRSSTSSEKMRVHKSPKAGGARRRAREYSQTPT